MAQRSLFERLRGRISNLRPRLECRRDLRLDHSGLAWLRPRILPRPPAEPRSRSTGAAPRSDRLQRQTRLCQRRSLHGPRFSDRHELHRHEPRDRQPLLLCGDHAHGVVESVNSTEAGATTMAPPSSSPVLLPPAATPRSHSPGAAPGAASYQVKRSPFPAVLMPLSPRTTGTSLPDNGLTNGAAYYYVVSAVNLGGESANSIEASATTYSPSQSWRLTYFGTTNDEGNAADSADPDGDGWTNAREFITGTDPTNAASTLRIGELQMSGSNITVSFPDRIRKNLPLGILRHAGKRLVDNRSGQHRRHRRHRAGHRRRRGRAEQTLLPDRYPLITARQAILNPHWSLTPNSHEKPYPVSLRADWWTAPVEGCLALVRPPDGGRWSLRGCRPRVCLGGWIARTRHRKQTGTAHPGGEKTLNGQSNTNARAADPARALAHAFTLGIGASGQSCARSAFRVGRAGRGGGAEVGFGAGGLRPPDVPPAPPFVWQWRKRTRAGPSRLRSPTARTRRTTADCWSA